MSEILDSVFHGGYGGRGGGTDLSLSALQEGWNRGTQKLFMQDYFGDIANRLHTRHGMTTDQIEERMELYLNIGGQERGMARGTNPWGVNPGSVQVTRENNKLFVDLAIHHSWVEAEQVDGFAIVP